MLGYLCVFMIQQTLTWTTGSLKCVCNLFACLRMQGTLVYILICRTFLESVQNLSLENLGVGAKPSMRTVWRPRDCSCLTWLLRASAFPLHHQPPPPPPPPRLSLLMLKEFLFNRSLRLTFSLFNPSSFQTCIKVWEYPHLPDCVIHTHSQPVICLNFVVSWPWPSSWCLEFRSLVMTGWCDMMRTIQSATSLHWSLVAGMCTVPHY